MSQLLIYGLVALSILGTLSGIAYKIRESGKDAIRLEWKEAQANQREDEIQRSILSAGNLSKDRQKAQVEIQERTVYVDRNIEKLVDSGMCLKPAGVSCLNAAINGEGNAGQCADGALPEAKPAG